MKLTIALLLSRVVLMFTTPGPGAWYIVRKDTPWHEEVVTAGYQTNACTIGVMLRAGDNEPMLSLKFYPGNTNPR